MLGLVAMEAEVLGARGSGGASPEELDALERLVGLGVAVVPLCVGGEGELADLLGGRSSLHSAAILEGGAVVVDGGRVHRLPTARGFEDGLASLLASHGHGWEDVAFLGASEAGFGCMLRAGCSVACEDAPAGLLEAARYVMGRRDEGGVVAALRELADSVEWGEEPSFVRRESERHPGLGDDERAGEPRRGGIFLLLGLAISLAAAWLMLASLERGVAWTLAAVLMGLAGVAIFYLGVGRVRDARERRG